MLLRDEMKAGEQNPSEFVVAACPRGFCRTRAGDWSKLFIFTFRSVCPTFFLAAISLVLYVMRTLGKYDSPERD